MPAPFLAGGAVVEAVRPALGDGLFQGIHLVLHLEVGLATAYLGIDLLGREAHGGDVEAVAVDEFVGVRLHELGAGAQGIRHIHHIHAGALGDGADELLAAHGGVEDIHGVVGGAAARRGDITDEAGEAHAARIDAVLGEVVVGEQLGADLRDTVDGLGALDGVLRRELMGCVGPEAADAGGREDGAMVLACHLEHVPQAVDANLPGQARLLLGHDAEEGGEVVDGVDVVFLDNLGQLLAIGDVGDGSGTALGECALGLGARDVTCHDIRAAITVAEFCSKLRANLARRANHKDFFHL